MTTPSDTHETSSYRQAEHELREGLENSRELIRRSRLLIELSECGGAPGRDEDDCPVAN